MSARTDCPQYPGTEPCVWPECDCPSPSAPDCQCPVCGRLHKHLQAGTPPMAIAGPSLLRPAETLKPASPSASAPDGDPNYAAVIREFGGVYFCETHHTDEVGAALDQLVALSTRPPAIDGQATARAIAQAVVDRIDNGVWNCDDPPEELIEQIYDVALALLPTAAPPAQGSAQAKEIAGQIEALAPTIYALAYRVRHLVAPAQGSAEISEQEMIALNRRLHGYDAPPVEAQGSERVRLSCAPDAISELAAKIAGEAAQYDIVPQQLLGDFYGTVQEILSAALGDSSPVEPTIAELQKRVADAQAALAARVLGDPRVCVGMPSPATEERYGLWIDPGPKR